MKRLLVPFLLSLPLAAGLAVAAAPAADRPVLKVRMSSCVTGVAEWIASMPAGEGATGLALRWTLQQRDGARWTRVAVPGWARWERSEPGAAGFVYRKRIVRLVGPASYRARVQFRWTDTDGDVVRRAVRTSSACRQVDDRPDLEVASLDVADLGDGSARYRVVVRNSGAGDALTEVAAALSVDGAEQPPRALPDLEADGTGTLTWIAPACRPGGRVVVEVDPADAIDEVDEDDDVLTRRC